MKKKWWNILITVFVFKHYRGGTKFWIQYMNWSIFLPRNKRILKNKLKNQIFLIVKGGANWSANWQCWISISKAPGALIGANTVTMIGLTENHVESICPRVSSKIILWHLKAIYFRLYIGKYDEQFFSHQTPHYGYQSMQNCKGFHLIPHNTYYISFCKLFHIKEW